MAPGPDLLLITRLVLTHGHRRPAVPAAIGMITAGAAQASLGAAGLAALLAINPALYAAFRWAGAAVLLGWAAIAMRSAMRPAEPDAVLSAPSSRRAFVQGLLCTGSNPKVGVFLMAFLPQFVPAGMNPAIGVTRLAAVYLALGLAWLFVWMNLICWLGRFVRVPTTTRIAHGSIAVVFGFFAIRLFLG